MHDEKAPSAGLAFLLSCLQYPEYPTPIGVFRSIDAPTFDSGMVQQIDEARAKRGTDLNDLLTAGSTWEVK